MASGEVQKEVAEITVHSLMTLPNPSFCERKPAIHRPKLDAFLQAGIATYNDGGKLAAREVLYLLKHLIN